MLRGSCALLLLLDELHGVSTKQRLAMSCECKCTDLAMEARCETVPHAAWCALLLLLLLCVVRGAGEDSDDDGDDKRPSNMYS